MMRISRTLMKEAGSGLGKTLSEILVCPLTKRPLRYCEKTGSLISDEIGVFFPIVDGIPCLIPKDGKMLEDSDAPNTEARMYVYRLQLKYMPLLRFADEGHQQPT